VELLGSAASPFVRKVRIALALKNIPYTWTVDAPSQPGSRVPEINPLGKIPVLITNDGPVYDSSVIIEYLEAIAPQPRLLPDAALQRVAVKRWEALADGLLDAAVSIMGERRRIPSEQSPSAIEKQRGKIERALAAASADLGSRAWCHGDSRSVADIAVGVAACYLDFRLPELAWKGRYPALAKLQQRLEASPEFISTRPEA
jgi:glutathione S-transferase